MTHIARCLFYLEGRKIKKAKAMSVGTEVQGNSSCATNDMYRFETSSTSVYLLHCVTQA
jgi:hypothetical protein